MVKQYYPFQGNQQDLDKAGFLEDVQGGKRQDGKNVLDYQHPQSYFSVQGGGLFLSSSHFATNKVLLNMNRMVRYTLSRGLNPSNKSKRKSRRKKIIDWSVVDIRMSFPRCFRLLKSNSSPIRKSRKVIPNSDINIICSSVTLPPAIRKEKNKTGDDVSDDDRSLYEFYQKGDNYDH